MRTMIAAVFTGAALAWTQVVPAQQPALPLVRPGTPQPMLFSGLTEFYRFVVQMRGLGRTDDDDLVAAVEASSTSEQVQGAAGDLLTVVKADLVAGGTSRLVSDRGNYPYYVLRRDPHGLVLLGVMFGDGYRAATRDGRLEFTVSLHAAGGDVRPMRFRVEGDALVNLSPAASERFPYIAIT